MKKIQLFFVVAAILVAGTGLYAKAPNATVYYVSGFPNQTGAYCDYVISATSCDGIYGVQCSGSFQITIEGQTQVLHNLYVSKKVNGGPCEMVHMYN